MKNLDSARLRPYRVKDPPEMVAGFGTFFPGTKVHSFEFPIDEGVVQRTLISTLCFLGESTRISTSIIDLKSESMTTAGIDHVYHMQAQIQNPDECLVWQYSPKLHKMRESILKSTKGITLDLRHCATQFMQYTGVTPPLRLAYETEMRKKGKHIYAKGSSGKWSFVHMKVDSEFPWEEAQKLAGKVFQNSLVQVFFNEETKKHSHDELVLWYHPEAAPIV